MKPRSSDSAISNFFRNLPNTLQQPGMLALLGSMVMHGLVFTTLPAFTSPEERPENDLRQVRVVNLSAEDQEGLPRTSAAPAGTIALPNKQTKKPTKPNPAATVTPSTTQLLPPPLAQNPLFSDPPLPPPLPILPRDRSGGIFQPLPPSRGSTIVISKAPPKGEPIPEDPSVANETPIALPAPSGPISLNPARPPSTRSTATPLRRDQFNPQAPLTAQAPQYGLQTGVRLGLGNPAVQQTPAPSPTPGTNQPGNTALGTPPGQTSALAQNIARQNEFLTGTRYDATGTDERKVNETWVQWITLNVINQRLAQVEHPTRTEPALELDYPLPFPVGKYQQHTAVVVATVGTNGKLTGEPFLFGRTGYSLLNKAAIGYVKQQLAQMPPPANVTVHTFRLKFKPPSTSKLADRVPDRTQPLPATPQPLPPGTQPGTQQTVPLAAPATIPASVAPTPQPTIPPSIDPKPPTP